MKLRIGHVFIALTVIIIGIYPLHGEDKATLSTTIRIVGNHNPPYSFIDEETGEVVGTAVEKAKLFLDRTGYNYSFHIMPWYRALREAATNSNTLILSLSRTPEREENFRWILPLQTVNASIIGRKSDNPQRITAEIKSNKVPIMCNVRSSFCEVALEMGVAPAMLEKIPGGNAVHVVTMLMRERINYFVGNYLTIVWELKKQQLPTDALVPYVTHVGDITDYLAAPIDLDEALVQKLNATAQALQQENIGNN